MKHIAAKINMNCVRLLESGISVSRGALTSVDAIIIDLDPNLSESLPPGICAAAVATPHPKENANPISVGDAPITYMRKAVITGIRIPLPSPERNCIPHKRRSVRESGLPSSLLFSTCLLNDEAPALFRKPRKTMKGANIAKDNINDMVGGKRRYTLSERKPPSRGRPFDS